MDLDGTGVLHCSCSVMDIRILFPFKCHCQKRGNVLFHKYDIKLWCTELGLYIHCSLNEIINKLTFQNFRLAIDFSRSTITITCTLGFIIALYCSV